MYFRSTLNSRWMGGLSHELFLVYATISGSLEVSEIKHLACVGGIWVRLRKNLCQNEFSFGNMLFTRWSPTEWSVSSAAIIFSGTIAFETIPGLPKHFRLVWVRVQVDMNKIIKDECSTGFQTIILSQQIS